MGEDIGISARMGIGFLGTEYGNIGEVSGILGEDDTGILVRWYRYLRDREHKSYEREQESQGGVGLGISGWRGSGNQGESSRISGRRGFGNLRGSVQESQADNLRSPCRYRTYGTMDITFKLWFWHCNQKGFLFLIPTGNWSHTGSKSLHLRQVAPR